MAEEKTSIVKGTIAGWLKAGLTSVVGLVSGACLMYLTPVINNTIKPAKPLANFATQATGLTVNFNNHSNGGVEGWWDFGDGSALEPFSPNLALVTHTYDKAGSYSVKLSLQNLIGEESDRTVTLNLDGASPTKPEISLFEVTSVTPEERAPAVYRVLSKVKNASLGLLSSGDDRPAQLDSDGRDQERYVTFTEMGTYTLRYSAISGKDIVEKTKTVHVGSSDGNNPLAKLTVSYQAVKVDRLNRTFHLPCVWQQNSKESICPFQVQRTAPLGFSLLSASLLNKDEKNAPVRNLSLEIAPEKNRFTLKGELVKPSSFLGIKKAPSWKAEVQAVMERRSAPIVINRGDVMMAIALNSSIKIPLQPMEAGWEVVHKQVNLELWDGSRKIWESNQPVVNAKVMLKNQTCYVTVAPQSDSMLLKIDALPSTALPPTPAPGPSALSLPPLSDMPVVAPNTPLPSPSSAPLPLVVRPAGFERLPLFPRTKSN